MRSKTHSGGPPTTVQRRRRAGLNHAPGNGARIPVRIGHAHERCGLCVVLPELHRDRVDFKYYESGHMAYLNQVSARQLKKDIADFIGSTKVLTA